MNNRILVIDDNEEINNFLLLYLEKYGFLVDQAITFETAKKLLRNENYDLVILDGELEKGKNGLDLLLFIDNSTKIILFSKKPIQQIIKTLKNYPQINDYQEKNFRGTELVMKIRVLLDIS